MRRREIWGNQKQKKFHVPGFIGDISVVWLYSLTYYGRE
jgi:hypothetical protein